MFVTFARLRRPLSAGDAKRAPLGRGAGGPANLFNVYLAAIVSISTKAPLGRSFTAKAARAGLSVG